MPKYIIVSGLTFILDEKYGMNIINDDKEDNKTVAVTNPDNGNKISLAFMRAAILKYYFYIYVNMLIE